MESDNLHLTKKQKRELHRQEKLEKRKKQELWSKVSRIGLWLLILFSIGVIVIGIVKSSANTSTSSSVASIALNDTDWYKGDKDAKVVLVEYSDFQCPACAFYYNVVSGLEREFGSKIKFVYRHFPLKQHKNANLAARASEAAGKQGKFWEMYNILFENQKIWPDQSNVKEIFKEYVGSLNLDKNRFVTDLDSKEVIDKVDNDIRSGEELRVNSTPTFFLNGKKLDNIGSYEQFKKIIEQEIAKESLEKK